MVEEVASALLDATRRMSMSGVQGGGQDVPRAAAVANQTPHPSLSTSTGSSSSGGSGWFGSTWHSSTSELDDKTGSLPANQSWLGSFTKRNRTYSDSESTRVKIDVMGWLAGGSQGDIPPRVRKISEPMGNGFGLGHQRVRRSSSKDVEEAMAGGLNKADIYMPPF